MAKATLPLSRVRNTFTPDRPSASLERCYGRIGQLAQLTRAALQSSVAIVGPYGIGKSSLLATAIPELESIANVISLQLSPEIVDCEMLAKQLIHQIAKPLSDKRDCTIQLGLPKIANVQIKSEKVYSYYNDGLLLQALLKLIDEIEYNPDVPIIFCLDQCELAPAPLAKFMRGLQALSLKGRENVTVVAAGNPPFIETMSKTEPRIHNFFTDEIDLGILAFEDARDLVQDRLDEWCANVQEKCGIFIEVEHELAVRIAILAGCHPLLLQLIGHRVIESEVASNDRIIDSDDLNAFIEAICSHSGRYSRLIDQLKTEGVYEPLVRLIGLASGSIPTCIDHEDGIALIGKDELARLISMGHVYIDRDRIRLIDELFRFRLLLDRGTPTETMANIEYNLTHGDLSDREISLIESDTPDAWE